MKSLILILLFAGTGEFIFSQNRFAGQELSINGFRNPSMGMEYRNGQLSLHAGYYITALEAGVTSQFFKTGITYWGFPVDHKPIPSSFYTGASYLRGLNLEYKNKNAIGVEAGFRWMIWKGFNLRIGAIALMSKGNDLKINPTPGISYSFRLNPQP
ncbi:MAG: hypothetical protein SH818_01260 [Saprospiraceae bacterium]|nr:hypothetical protein [Saprospiraceae bacterium]